MAVTILKKPLPKRREEGDNGRRPDAVDDCRSCSLRVCPETSGAIAKFSEHEAD
jgi:hypothetical protein